MSDENKPKPTANMVTFVEDPYGFCNIEISEAQAQSEELKLDDDLDTAAADYLPDTTEPPLELPSEKEQQEQLERLAQVLEEVQQEEINTLSKPQPEEDPVETLQAQIEEDLALEDEIRREQEAIKDGSDPEIQAALPKFQSNGELDLCEMESCIEALLFMSDKPVSEKRLGELLGPDYSHELISQALSALTERYQNIHHGFELSQVSGGYQLRTKPGRAALAKKLAKVQTQRLSSGGMETLAIVAYRQPVMKEEIDKIRGVDSSYFIRGLLEKRLIEITGRSELPGRPMLYSTTSEFLELFGLKDLSAMPPLHEVEKMIPTSQSGDPENEDPRVKQMRKLVGEMKADTSTTLVYNPREDEKILKEIREKVQAIPTSTPYLDQQKALEKETYKQAQEAAALAATQFTQPELLPETAVEITIETNMAVPETTIPPLVEPPTETEVSKDVPSA